MKIIKIVLILLVFLIAASFVVLNSIKQEIDEDTLPTNVYEEDSNLLTVVNARLFDLFVSSVTNEYTVVEEIMNLIILDSIRENVNADYDPLGDCETIECEFIVHEDYYYINYLYVVLNDDDQLVVYVSGGTDKYVDFNTVTSFVFDVDIDYVGTEISLTLAEYYIADKKLSLNMLDKIFGKLDAENIEAQVTTGALDLEDYSYTISFNPFEYIPFS